jgi:hypothetical protein
VKRVLPVILTMSFLLQSFTYLVIFADYQINKDYISKNLCENRDKPEMKCNGKCQLCKKLKAEDKKENKGLPTQKNVKQIVLFSIKKSKYNFSLPGLSSANSYTYTACISSLHKIAVFHPPLG